MGAGRVVPDSDRSTAKWRKDAESNAHEVRRLERSVAKWQAKAGEARRELRGLRDTLTVVRGALERHERVECEQAVALIDAALDEDRHGG